MLRLEEEFLKNRPSIVIVVGDVNSTLAAALVAAKLNIRIAHVEAGYRSFDKTMPEEINRILVDHMSTYLFTPTKDAITNLYNEGVDASKIYMVGNVMAETLLSNLESIKARDLLSQLKLDPKEYVVATIHRPENVDNPDKLMNIIEALSGIPELVVFPVHPKTKAKIDELGVDNLFNDNIVTIDPLSYMEMMNLLHNSKLILTDSGGLQEEACMLKVPCITVRNNTERVATIDVGANQLVAADKDMIKAAVDEAKSKSSSSWVTPDMWDDKVAARIIDILLGRNSSDRFVEEIAYN
jgi:UDP-N-acetylglucosamine 2-epimerase (non-hydrolysing)